MGVQGKIINMSLISTIVLYNEEVLGEEDEDVAVYIEINGEKQENYKISLAKKGIGYINFDTPLNVNAGGYIGFTSKGSNRFARFTAVSALIEIDI